MSSSTLKMIAGIMVLLAIVLVGVTVQVYSKNSQTAQQAAAKEAEQQKSPQIMAVVASKTLTAYQKIDRSSVQLVPLAVAPASYYTNLDEVVDKVPLVDIEAGSPLTQRYFKEGNDLARAIPAGYEALSVEINDVIAVGGFLRPGDIVDVLVYLRNGGGVEQAQSRVLLREVRLLAYEERIIDRPEGVKEDEEQRQRRVRTAVLAVPSADTTKLMLGASMGELRLALHGGDTPDVAGKDGKDEADKAMTVAELIKDGKAQPAAKPAGKASSPSVEIYRGAERERVATRN